MHAFALAGYIPNLHPFSKIDGKRAKQRTKPALWLTYRRESRCCLRVADCRCQIRRFVYIIAALIDTHGASISAGRRIFAEKLNRTVVSGSYTWQSVSTCSEPPLVLLITFCDATEAILASWKRPLCLGLPETLGNFAGRAYLVVLARDH